MSGVTTHVLDTATGRPAAGVPTRLLREGQELSTGCTDDDGRWTALPGGDTQAGSYQLEFAVGAYFGGRSFHPRIVVEFTVLDPAQHHHVPLLVSPFAYTTYRGS